MNSKSIVVRVRGQGGEFSFKNDDLKPDIGAGILKGAQHSLGGILLVGSAAVDDRGE